MLYKTVLLFIYKQTFEKKISLLQLAFIRGASIGFTDSLVLLREYGLHMLFLFPSRAALLEQMPLMEVNRSKSDLANGDAGGDDMLLDTTNAAQVNKTNEENKQQNIQKEVGLK